MLDIWKTIKAGGHPSKEALLSDIKNAGFSVGAWAFDVINGDAFVLPQWEINIDLVKLSVNDLGLNEPAPLEEIFRKAADLGLKKCPLYTAPYLRLAFPDQEEGKSLYIASDLASDKEGHSSLFRLVKSPADKNTWLVGCHRHNDLIWDPDEEFVFCK